MPTGLHRYQQEGDDHFLTFSCDHRLPYLNTPAARDRFLTSLETTRKRYHFDVLGYVVMPEHVHLLVGEPETKPLANALQALKLSVSKLSTQRPFWQARYHDFNVLTDNKRVEKLHYMHHKSCRRPGVHTGRLALILLPALSSRSSRRHERYEDHPSMDHRRPRPTLGTIRPCRRWGTRLLTTADLQVRVVSP